MAERNIVMDSPEELQALAAQLGNPKGEFGIGLAEMMHATNIGMTKHSIALLHIENGNKVLELGHGNGNHIGFVLQQATDLQYSGLEISELMHEEAMKINAENMQNNMTFFHLYDGLTLPFADNSFDRIFTVNTIYFWEKPEALLNEIFRVLAPGGIFNLTFSQKRFMETLPFTPYGFELYDDERMAELAGKTPFKITASKTQTETVKTKTGELVAREFTTVSLVK